MKNSHLNLARGSGRAQRGFTLVELMVATTIAVFLLGGLFTTVQSTRRAYGNQNLLSQLQDNERLAISLLTSVVEAAGYFPDPRNNLPGTVLPAGGSFGSDGQGIFGAAGDTITVRYAAGLNDNIYNCIGGRNTAVAGFTVFTNTFKVAGNQLICTYNGVDYPLIAANTTAGVTTLGVKSMAISYGVQLAGGTGGSCTTSYLTTAQMVATGNWNLVCSVKVTLTFINPMSPTAGPDIPITRVIAVMNTAGT
ncbi:MAG: PilW family protein [Steroidobacteraceae bacterium]